jgi:hypothetical protein
MQQNTVIPALVDINVPAHVLVVVTDNMEDLYKEATKRSMLGFTGSTFYGTAFVQGSRLQFTTAMPVEKMLEVSRSDRSHKKADVAEAMEHSNRPLEVAHAREVRGYLLSTACAGEKFILPSFTFNYGVGLDGDSPVATLILFGAGTEGTSTWPAVLCLPSMAKLDTTDGAHRRGTVEGIMHDPGVGLDQRDALRKNAVDVKIVFEASRQDSHQDFADCGKAKAIAKSLITTFDVRDQRNKRSRDLVFNAPFLKAYVDATASNVNLSAKSHKIWSMSAIRLFVGHVVDATVDDDAPVTEKMMGAEDFFVALVSHLPQLKALDEAKDQREPAVTTGELRERRGGDIALRGVGMAIFARAFLHCHQHEVSFDDMAQALAKVDWHVLSCEREELPQDDPERYVAAVYKAATPAWAHMLAIGPAGYRVRSSSEDADTAWAKVKAQLFENNKQDEAA